MTDNKAHWEKIYTEKKSEEMSWTQTGSLVSLEIFKSLDLPKNISILDVGAGEGTFVNALIDMGYENITVVEISAQAIKRAKEKLGEKAKVVNWVEESILDFKPKEKFDIWHDRAVFHFFTNFKDKEKYIQLLYENINQYLILATFKTDGPKKCSGLEICQYDKQKFEELLGTTFQQLANKDELHQTPFETEQKFIYGLFKKK